METSTMIRQLRRTAKKHENDKLYTFDTNISLMCTDVANRLEELEKEKKEIRAKAIDEFAEKIQWEYLNSCGLKQREIDFLVAVSSMVAEQMKGGAV